MNTKRKHGAEAVVTAITDSAGIKSTIARRLGVHWNTVDRYLLMYPSAALAYKNEVESVGDFVEAVILESIKAKDVETAKWYAKNKLKHRGYSERYEFKEIKELSDAELIDALQGIIGTGLSDGPGSPSAGADKKPTTIH